MTATLSGESNPSSKLREDDICEILWLRRQGFLPRVIGPEFGVSVSTATKICSGEIWGHVAPGIRRAEGRRIQNVESHFWSRAEKTDTCWLWQGCTRLGYGRLIVHGKFVSAHRFAWELVHGNIPKGMNVCHACDVPACVNPEHLFLGTHSDNMNDMALKGRGGKYHPPFGEHHHNAKLKDAEREEIIWLARQGHTQAAIGREFGVAQTLVGKIIRAVDRSICRPHGPRPRSRSARQEQGMTHGCHA